MSSTSAVAKRRDRCIATILGFKEDYVDEFVDDEISDEFRKVILDSVNDVCSLAITLIDEASVVNELFLEKVEDIINGSFGDDDGFDDG